MKAGNYYVYIMTNWTHEVMYIGVTNDLMRRVSEHRLGVGSQFAGRYNLNKLVYFEHDFDVAAMIAREKQLKSWRREKKDALVKSVNPEWRDLFDGLTT